MVLENRSASFRKTVVTKREIDADAIKSVYCEQQEVEWNCIGGWLRFPVEIRPGQTAKIKVEYLDPFGESASSEGMKYRIKVFARRHLSEIRDDYVCRNDFLNHCAGRVMRLLK
jgi:hypothetical protein